MFDNPPPTKGNLLGIGVSATTYEEATEHIIQAALEQRSFIVESCAVHPLMTGVLDSSFGKKLNAFDLVVPDGQPLRWALSWVHGIRLPDRVYGPNLMLHLCRRASQQKLPIFLFGSSSKVLELLENNLMNRFPGLKIAGRQASRFRTITPEEDLADIEAISASGARLIFVGLGCPRQEIWAFAHRARLSVPLVCVGGAFDCHAGTSPQAPLWMQNRGLEWAFRLTCEPTRLWKRYLTLNPLYLFLLFLQKSGIKKFPFLDPEIPECYNGCIYG